MSEWKIGQKIIHGRPRVTWVPAESPAAPVERVLAAGWEQRTADRWLGCYDCPYSDRPQVSYQKGCTCRCETHAAAAGAFATPAPTVTPKCDHARNAKCVEPGGCAMARETKKQVKPAPRCEYRTAAHEGTPVERVMFAGGSARRLVACDNCYLESERCATNRQDVRDTSENRAATDSRPRATVGVVPQVFGLSVGILSRGMAK